jgi:hypothetical protein
MQKMADKGRLTVQQRTQFSFLLKQKVLWKRRDGFVPVLVCGGPLLQKLFKDFISSFNRTVQCWKRNADVLQVRVAHRTLKLSE